MSRIKDRFKQLMGADDAVSTVGFIVAFPLFFAGFGFMADYGTMKFSTEHYQGVLQDALTASLTQLEPGTPFVSHKCALGRFVGTYSMNRGKTGYAIDQIAIQNDEKKWVDGKGQEARLASDYMHEKGGVNCNEFAQKTSDVDISRLGDGDFLLAKKKVDNSWDDYNDFFGANTNEYVTFIDGEKFTDSKSAQKFTDAEHRGKRFSGDFKRLPTASACVIEPITMPFTGTVFPKLRVTPRTICAEGKMVVELNNDENSFMIYKGGSQFCEADKDGNCVS